MLLMTFYIKFILSLNNFVDDLLMKTTARQIEIRGLVQGVGFRPFIYRLAHEFHLFGTVENNNRGVMVWVEGTHKSIEAFLKALPERAPLASGISSIEVHPVAPGHFNDFTIVKSKTLSEEITEVSPDIGVCPECLADMQKQPHRLGYSFTNCTNCGPRFTIIQDLPYDRHNTTMKEFEMCERCRNEYSTILDRRFHAQPVACNHCGPHYTLHTDNEEIAEINDILQKVSGLIEEGKILAIKGLGGYHLGCNPFVEDTVRELRLRKTREGKPFALMFRNLEAAKEFLYMTDEEELLLTGWRRPIVLLKSKGKLAPSVSIGLDTVGVMLPYMPFHYQLFDFLKLPAIVLTSGNISDEPVIIEDREARDKLGKVADAILTYNRKIHNRTDDSVVFHAGHHPRIIRRSRSYAPSPIPIHLDAEGIFSAGAELVNCFAMGKGKQVLLSQHIGDLQNLETLAFYKESVERHKRLFRFEAQLAVADLHPDYLSTRYVRELEIPMITVQHHHAHIASCMAEHGLDEKVIGVSFDGTGLGTDGHVWGGEFLIADLIDFERAAHFEYIPQPGGDAATKHPWRMMLSYLVHYYGRDVLERYPFLFRGIDRNETDFIINMLEQGLNAPLTSSAGRLFDAVSSLAGICRNTTYHAEAPMRLEAAARGKMAESYSFDAGEIISFRQTFDEMIHDLRHERSVDHIASKFHHTVVSVILKKVEDISASSGIRKVVLSGGSFQNRILLASTEERLSRLGFEVYSHIRVPSNDGGIALGQLAIAAKQRDIGSLG